MPVSTPAGSPRRGNARDRDRRARGRDLDPTAAELLHRGVETLLEGERLDVERERTTLVGHGNADGPDAGDAGLGLLGHLVLLRLAWPRGDVEAAEPSSTCSSCDLCPSGQLHRRAGRVSVAPKAPSGV